MPWLVALVLILTLWSLGFKAWRGRLSPAFPEEHEELRLWLEEWLLVDDIVRAAYAAGTANPDGVSNVRLIMGSMETGELRCAVAAFLQHRTVRQQVAKYMEWRYGLKKTDAMRKLNDLSAIARV